MNDRVVYKDLEVINGRRTESYTVYVGNKVAGVYLDDDPALSAEDKRTAHVCVWR